jgi:hypothetical protein
MPRKRYFKRNLSTLNFPTPDYPIGTYKIPFTLQLIYYIACDFQTHCIITLSLSLTHTHTHTSLNNLTEELLNGHKENAL